MPNNDIRLEFDNDVSRDIIDASEMFHECKVLIVSNENPLEETVDIKKLPNIGVIAHISHRLELPNGKTRVIITGTKKDIAPKMKKIISASKQSRSTSIGVKEISSLIPEDNSTAGTVTSSKNFESLELNSLSIIPRLFAKKPTNTSNTNSSIFITISAKSIIVMPSLQNKSELICYR